MIATSSLLSPRDGAPPSPSAGRLPFGASADTGETGVHRRFQAAAARRPGAPAAVFGEAVLTYGALDAESGALAAALRARGVGPDVRVAVLMERGPELPVALLAVLKAGGAYVPVDAAYPDERIRLLLEDSGAALVLTHARAAHRVPAGGPPALSVVVDPAAHPPAGPRPDAAVHPESLAYVVYTSGSTGRPKGVGIAHGAVDAHCAALADLLALGPADRVAQVSSLGFDISVEEIFPTWAAGGAVVFRPDDIGPAEFTAWVESARITVLNLPTAFWHAWVDALAAGGAAVPACVRLVVVGGEAARASSLAAWRAAAPRVRWLNSYGPTEATVTATTYEPAAGEPGEVPIGTARAGVRTLVLDDALRPAGGGELFLGGSAVARGYLGRPALTAERFLPDPFAGRPGARMYRTGDRVQLRADGVLLFGGRLDDQVKVGGFRVEPGEVEAAVAAHPAVAQAVVVARAGAAGVRLVAYAVPRAGLALEPAAVRGWLRERLPAFMVPSVVVPLPELPLNANGKVDRRALPAPAEAAAPAAYATETEAAVAEAWDEVLGTSGVAADEDFFDLGGHSLLAMQVLSRLRARLGVELPVRALFEARTVAGLAARVAAARAVPSAAQPPLLPVDRGGRLPLSFAQQRIWFLHQLEPESPFYNIPFAVRLRGALDAEALRAALGEIVRRHEALRTSFAADAAGSHQVVHPAPDPFPLPVADLRALPATWAEGEVLRLMADEAEVPFDLAAGLLLRALLIRRSDDEHVLFLNLHHVAGDGWSLGVVFRELAALYAAFHDGAAPALPPLPVQYADFAAWQRGWMEGDALEAQLAFWRARLEGAPATLDLPTDRPRPAVQSHRGEVRAFRVPPETAARLRDVARAADATLFMVLLAAFDLFLARLSGREDVVVGSPIAGRVRRELEPLVGFFVNTMALRTDVSGDPDFVALVRRVRETTLEAYAHQDLPFERVVEELQPQRTRAHHPLFQACFALQNVAMDPVRMPGLTLRLEDVDSGTSKFDLFLEMAEQEDGVRGSLEYATDLWEPETADRMIRLFLRLLDGVAAAPGAPVSRALAADAAERRTAVARWNRTAAPYPRASTIHAEFAAVAEAEPARTALVWDGGEMAYGALHAASSRLANALRARGVRPDEPVAVLAERGPDAIVALLGILKAGAAYVPVDPRYPAPRIALMLRDCGVRVAVADARGAAAAPEGIPLLRMDGVDVASASDTDPRVDAGADAAAYVVFTSGSTGTPKGVVVPHRAVLRLVRGADFAAMGADETWLHLAPLAFDASTLEIWAPLLNGGRVAVHPPQPPSAESLADFLLRHRVTSAWLTAGLFHHVVDAAPEGLGGLRQLLAGGDVLSVPHVRRVLSMHPALRLVNGYGPTENTTFSCCHGILPEDAERASIPIGRPIANSTAYVLDAGGAPVPPDVPGELYVGGDGVARGYLGAAGATAARYVPDPFSAEPGARMYRTGDRVRWRPEGMLEFLGRMDQQVKLRGFRVEPGEVAAALERHPAVAAAAADVRGDGPGDRRLVAWVVPARPAPAPDEPLAFAAPPADAGHVRQWEALFDDVYQGSRGTEEGGADFDIVGWNSSYTGQPIPAEEMREWVDATVARILALRAGGPGRVLELGVGTGLLLFRVAPRAAEYLGIDVSREVLETLGRRVRAASGLPPVRLVHGEAADLRGVTRGGFDTAILNSVAQYFPSAAYFARVVAGAVDALADGGALFVGDVRARGTLEALRAAAEFHAAPDTRPLRDLRHHAAREVEEEEELVADPDFFRALAARLPRVSAVEVRLKRGRHHNELTRHRYDVVLRVGPAVPRPPAPSVDWARHAGSLDAVRRLLAHGAPLAVTGIPDARLVREVRIVELARRADAAATVLDARRALAADPPAGIDPEEVWAMAEGMGMAAELRPTPGAPGRFDALFRASDDASADWPSAPAPEGPLAAYTGDPSWAGEVRALGATLRAYLKEQLPEHLVPSAVVVVDSMPLTANGKVDRRALPAPRAPRADDAGAHAAPRTEVEAGLAAIWAEVLRLERVWVDDDFFELGGHSLLATQLVTRVREAFGVQLPLARVFEAPTVAALARVVEDARVDAMAAMLDELDGLSDDEVRALLEAEAGLAGA